MADQKPAEPAQPPKPSPAPEPKPSAPPEPPKQEPPKQDESKLPTKVKFAVLYGYYDENNRFRQWHEGDVVSDPAEIKLLVVDRQAPLIDMDTGKRVHYAKDDPRKS